MVKVGVVVLALFIFGCSDESAEQAEGRCKTEGIEKLPALSGPRALVTGMRLLEEYVSGCMAAKGFRRGDKGGWTR